MQTLLLTILVLGLLVFVHELGHFLTAKWCGIAVPRFSLGLGPRLVGIQIGETDYCLSAVPFGGYVKMAGMEGEEAFEGLEGGELDPDAEEQVPPEKRFEGKPLWQRLVVICAGVTMNFLLGWGIYVGLALHDGIPTIEGTTVAGVEPAALAERPELAGLAGGGTVQEVEGRPVANWYEINEGILASEDGVVNLALVNGRMVAVPAADEEARQAIARALLPLVAPVIADVESGSPAAAGGLRPGDRVVSIDGLPTASFGAISEIVRERPDQLLAVVVERPDARGARQLSLTVRTGVQQAPRLTDGKFVDIGWLGVGTEVGKIELGPVEAVVVGSRATWRAGTLIVDGLIQLVSGGVSLRSLGGPVAIGQLTGHFARQGFSSLLAWVALFSINLAILNLLPIPVLDGGHVLFLGIEATRGRPLSPRQKMRMSQVGLAFLGLLMAWAFTADILRLVGL